MYIYYDSKTGNVQRFVNKLEKIRPDWHYIKVNSDMKIEHEGHFITFTTKIGEIPATTEEFISNGDNAKYLKTVSSSGNRNWGVFFAVAANKIEEKYNVPLLMKFELSGTNVEAENYVNYLEENYN